MESNLSIKHLTSLCNLGEKFCSEKIEKIKAYKSFLVFLTKSNLIISLNQTTEKIVDKCFSGNVKDFKINENRTIPMLFVLLGTSIEVLSFNDFISVKTYYFDYCVYDFSLFDLENNFNLEILLSNELNEIVFYSKGLILENKKVLSKEKEQITKIVFQEPFLVWVVGASIKIFDLDKKILVYKKNYENEIKKINEKNSISNNRSSNLLLKKDNLIDFNIQDRYISIIVVKKILDVVRIIDYNFTNYSSKKFLYEELFTFKVLNFDLINNSKSNNKNSNVYVDSEQNHNNEKHSNESTKYNIDYNNETSNRVNRNTSNNTTNKEELILGAWLNINRDKIFFIKQINYLLNDEENAEIEIEVHNFKEKLININVPININFDLKILKFEFDQPTFSILIYNDYDIFSLYLIDQKTKLFNQLKKLNLSSFLNNNPNSISNNDLDQDRKSTPSNADNSNARFGDPALVITNVDKYEICFKENKHYIKIAMENFKEFNNFDEKLFTILSVFNNLRLFIQKSNSKKIEILIENYIQQSVVEKQCSLICDIMVEFLIKSNQFEFCFNYINRFLNHLSNRLKEKVIIYFVSVKNFEFLETFVNILQQFDLHIDELLSDKPFVHHLPSYKFLQFLKMNIDNLKGEEKLKLINCYIYICILTKNYNEAIFYSIIYGKIELNNLNSLLNTNSNHVDNDDTKLIENNNKNDKNNENKLNNPEKNLNMVKHATKRVYNLIISKKIEYILFEENFKDYLFYNFSISQLLVILRNLINQVSSNKDIQDRLANFGNSNNKKDLKEFIIINLKGEDNISLIKKDKTPNIENENSCVENIIFQFIHCLFKIGNKQKIELFLTEAILEDKNLTNALFYSARSLNLLFEILLNLDLEVFLIKFTAYMFRVYNSKIISNIDSKSSVVISQDAKHLTKSNSNSKEVDDSKLENTSKINTNNNTNAYEYYINLDLIYSCENIISNRLINFKIFLLTKEKKFTSVLDLIVLTEQKIEKAVFYIEDLEINQSDKKELYDYLHLLIKDYSSISSIQKYYYISLFKEQNFRELLKEDSLKNIIEEDKKFLLLIINQLKLSLDIVDCTEVIAKEQLQSLFKRLKLIAQKGKCFSFDDRQYSCCYNYCDNPKYMFKDEIILFANCNHSFHKNCLMLINEEIKLQESNQYNLLMLEDVIDESVLEKITFNTEMISVAKFSKNGIDANDESQLINNKEERLLDNTLPKDSNDNNTINSKNRGINSISNNMLFKVELECTICNSY